VCAVNKIVLFFAFAYIRMFYSWFNEKTGVSLILDCVGASHCAENWKSIRMDGRWILYGLMGGAVVNNYPLGNILRKRVHLIGTTLRSRSLAYKSNLIQARQREREGGRKREMNPLMDPLTFVFCVPVSCVFSDFVM